MEDVRYYVMSSIRANVATVMEKNKGVGNHHFPLVPFLISVYLLHINLFFLNLFLFLGCFASISGQCVHSHVQP